MKLKKVLKYFVIPLVAISFSSICFSQTSNSKTSPNEKSQIIESILSRFLRDYPDEVNSDEIVLSSLNIGSRTIGSRIVLKHQGVKILKLSPEEIRSKALRERFVDYLVLSKLHVKDSKVSATLEYLSVRSVNSQIEPFFGHGFEWEGTKKSGRWTFKCVNTSAFTSISGEEEK